MLIMKAPYTKSGKCGDIVWQNARYGQICYPAFIPANPRTPAQVAVRGNFGAVSARWRTITEEQRLIWNAVAIVWPTTQTLFSLQENTDLNTTNWVSVGAAPTDDGTNNTVVIAPAAGNRHFRLHWP
jgi:hypothetical protein